MYWKTGTFDLIKEKHPTNAKAKLQKYYNQKYEDDVITMYKSEYSVFHFNDSYYTNR